jgi:hypothetical protein
MLHGLHHVRVGVTVPTEKELHRMLVVDREVEGAAKPEALAVRLRRRGVVLS